MQTNNTDYNKHLKNKDEDSINFRPSPNFKHMKKYLKCKFEESASNSPNGVEQESCGITNAIVEEPERTRASAASMMVQPPLPPNPPPPDSPIQTTLKKEIDDDDYALSNNDHSGKHESSEPKANPGPEKEMCRQFARGMCTRGDSCIYAHEVILSQLKDVYTFCKNFQNANGCNLPKCKFVHATVFEKEYYYRTGYLPPHALAHIKESTSNPTHQYEGPGPSTSVQPEAAGGVFNVPPPPIMVPNVRPPVGPGTGMGVPPVAVNNINPNAPTPGIPPAHKRNLDELQRDALLGEPPAKKTKMCDITDFRLQCVKQNFDNLLVSSEEWTKKNAAYAAKLKRIQVYVDFIQRMWQSPSNQSGIPTTNNSSLPTGGINVRNEKEINNLVDPLKIRYAPNLLSLGSDDNASSKNLHTLGQVSPALMRLLLKNDQASGSDRR